MKAHQEQASLLRAVANPTRWQILRLLRFGGAYVCHLTFALGKRQPYISQHLAVLRRTGLVVDERHGLNVFYRLSDERIGELLDSMAALMPDETNGARLRAFQGPLVACPCPKCAEELGIIDEAQACRAPEYVELIERG